MFCKFTKLDDLKAQVIDDLAPNGSDVSTLERFPLRFVLLDNFRDCLNFVRFAQAEANAVVHSVDKWIESDYPDLIISYSRLADKIKEFVVEHRPKEGDQRSQNYVITPFSELARFYDNDKVKQFDTLLKTIKGIEANAKGAELHQRFYIPIVGLEGKMEIFCRDSQSIIWQLQSGSTGAYPLIILTNGSTFGVRGLEKHYTVIRDVREWLSVWNTADENVSPNIICTSPSLFANQCYAQPDNAFTFVSCHDAHEFLTQGLQLNFSKMTKSHIDGDNWDMLAKDIDLSQPFNFLDYVKQRFSFGTIDCKTFLRLWFDNPAQFDRWLLARFYLLQPDAESFFCRILAKTSSLTGNDFVEQMVLDFPDNESEVAIRQSSLRELAKRNVIVSDTVASTLIAKLEKVAQKDDAQTALKYYSGITEHEKELVVSWLAEELITDDQIRDLYPDLYYYSHSPLGIPVNETPWLADYMREYKRAKLANRYTAEIEMEISTHNGDASSFDSWYQSFSTTFTLLQNRHDIEKFYWIDGLGLEWIPLIKHIIAGKHDQNIYLNDIKIARSQLPSTTCVNKPDLQRLTPETLEKIGDLDELAHRPSCAWPKTIIRELQIVRDAIDEIVKKFNDKKIAIISDHGLTYLSQLCDGLGLNGVESDHHGRVAHKSSGVWTTDAKYFVLDDGKTACALRHNSLCGKVPKGQGTHGGCTPEEVLVPIFIISRDKSNAEWSATLCNKEISGANPRAEFIILNCPENETPHVEYNGKEYNLRQLPSDTSKYETGLLPLDNSCRTITLHIGDSTHSFDIDVSTGAKQDDNMFDF